MKSVFRYVARPHVCGYLPDQTARMEYDVVFAMEPAEYLARLERGWRRFGHSMFRPRCPDCSECRSLRIDVPRFRPDRSMRRVRARNLGAVSLNIREASGVPEMEILDLYDRYHRFQADHRGWPHHEERDPLGYRESFLDNPFPTQEWRYRLDGRLVGVGYVDALPGALSAIYFVHDPDVRDRSLGTWNILCLIDRAADEGIPFVYLGYYVAGCRSLSYKARFARNEILGRDGVWSAFR